MEKNNPSRRQFLRLAGLGALGFSLEIPLRARVPPSQAAGSKLVYIGTYTSGLSEGIYVCRLDLSSGELRRIDVAKGVVNPSFLTIDRQGRYLYAVNEVKEFEKKASGAVSDAGTTASVRGKRRPTLSTLGIRTPAAGSGPPVRADLPMRRP